MAFILAKRKYREAKDLLKALIKDDYFMERVKSTKLL